MAIKHYSPFLYLSYFSSIYWNMGTRGVESNPLHVDSPDHLPNIIKKKNEMEKKKKTH